MDGTKRFAKDGRKEGCFHTVGGNGPDALAAAPAIVIGEGYATMCSAKQALGFPTVAAFDSGNLKAVAVALKERYPEKPIVFLGDNDVHLEQSALKRNPGKVKAQEAAREVGGTAIFPIFAPNEQDRDPAGFTDFNDLATKSVLGCEGLQRQVKGYVDDVIERHQAQTKQQAPTEQQELVQTQQIKRARKVAM
jgi:putative DNA primase/helicase